MGRSRLPLDKQVFKALEIDPENKSGKLTTNPVIVFAGFVLWRLKRASGCALLSARVQNHTDYAVELIIGYRSSVKLVLR